MAMSVMFSVHYEVSKDGSNRGIPAMLCKL